MKTLILTTLPAMILLASGCSNVAGVGERVKTQNDLKQIVLTYQTHESNTGKPPAKLADLASLKSDSAQLYQAIESGKYVVVWNASSSNQPDGTSKVILAYEANADAKGNRNVAMMDGATMVMDTAEFEKTPKAKAGK